MGAERATQASAKSTTAIGKKFKGFKDEERAAMKERAQELKAEARRGQRMDKADGESAVLAKIAEMPEPERAMATRLHPIIKASAPVLSPKTRYGMPAYAKDGKVVCFGQSARKFNSRYATFGFSDEANLDEGAMWPTSFALKDAKNRQSPLPSLIAWTAGWRGERRPDRRPPPRPLLVAMTEWRYAAWCAAWQPSRRLRRARVSRFRTFPRWD